MEVTVAEAAVGVREYEDAREESDDVLLDKRLPVW